MRRLLTWPDAVGNRGFAGPGAASGGGAGAPDGSNRPGIGVCRTQGGRRMFFKRIAIIGPFVDILADAMAVAQHENRASTERLRTNSTCRAAYLINQRHRVTKKALPRAVGNAIGAVMPIPPDTGEDPSTMPPGFSRWSEAECPSAPQPPRLLAPQQVTALRRG